MNKHITPQMEQVEKLIKEYGIEIHCTKPHKTENPARLFLDCLLKALNEEALRLQRESSRRGQQRKLREIKAATQN